MAVSGFEQQFGDLAAQILLQQCLEIVVREGDVIAAALGAHLEAGAYLLRITHFDARFEQLLGRSGERSVALRPLTMAAASALASAMIWAASLFASETRRSASARPFSSPSS